MIPAERAGDLRRDDSQDGADRVHPPAPPGLRLAPDPGTRLLAGDSVLVGGSPARVLRLTQAGARQVTSWFAGTPVPAEAGARTLARKLLDAGIAHPDFSVPGASVPGASVPGASVPGASVPGGSGLRGSGPGGLGTGTDLNPGRARGLGPPGGENRRAATSSGDDPARTTSAPGPAPFPGIADVTVVIPVRGRHAELDRCLAGLRDLPHVLVVDDASADPAAIKRIAAEHGAAVVHRPVNGGPGAARNTGLAAVTTEFVAFLDSDCVPAPGWLGNLLPHFSDPAVGAVAPRIVAYRPSREHRGGWLARYEGASSTLDMGARPSIVRPGARVSYVPGAALVVRKDAASDGFRDRMYVGEDVDFIWRLAKRGWRVRYEPRAVMGHDHRVAFRAWFARRADYGTSAAALEQLHPGSVRPLYASWWTAAAWTAAVAGRPIAAAALTATAVALLSRRLSKVTGEPWPVPVFAPAPADSSAGRSSDNSNRRSANPADDGRQRQDPPERLVTARLSPLLRPRPGRRSARSGARGPALRQSGAGAWGSAPGQAGAGTAAWGLALRLAGGGTLAAARPLGSAISRTWWPLALPVALALPKLRVPLAALVLTPPLLDWADRKPPLDPARYVAARLLDDAAYSVGVWHGCLARRTLRPLLPVIGARRPPG